MAPLQRIGGWLLLLGVLAPALLPAQEPKSLADIEAMRNEAARQGVPLILVFTREGDREAEPLTRTLAREIRNTSEAGSSIALALVSLDDYPGLAREYRILGIPSLIAYDRNGLITAHLRGFPRAPDRALLFEELRRSGSGLPEVEALERIEKNPAAASAPEVWEDLLALAGDPERGTSIRNRILALTPFPGPQLVTYLSHPRLAVRAGALDLLETYHGVDHGFDPWTPTQNEASITRWRDWLNDPARDPYAPQALGEEDIDRYARLLVEGDEGEVRQALRALFRGGPEAFTRLTAISAATEAYGESLALPTRALHYARILDQLGAVDPLTTARHLVFGVIEVRQAAIAETALLGPGSFPLLRDFLDAEEPLLRESASAALIRNAPELALPLLAERLPGERNTEVIIAVLDAIADQKPPASTEHGKAAHHILRQGLDSPREDIVIQALRSIAKMKDNTFIDALPALIEDSRWRIQVAALECVAELKANKHSALVAARLDDSDEFVQVTAINTIAKINPKPYLGKLEEIYLRNDNLKAHLVEVFGSLDQELPPSFNRITSVEDPVIRLAVARAAGSFAGGVPLATRLADDPDPDVAAAAVASVAQNSRGRGTLRFLESKLRSAEPAVAKMILSGFDPQRANLEPVPDRPHERGDSAKPRRLPRDQEILAAFLGPKKVSSKKQPSSSAATGTSEGFVEAALPFFEQNEDLELKQFAAIFLLRLGRSDGAEYLAGSLPYVPEEMRRDLAWSLDNFWRDGNLPVYRAMLNDESSSVRSAAFNAVFAFSGVPALEELLLEQVFDSAVSFNPSELLGYRAESYFRNPRIAAKWQSRLASAIQSGEWSEGRKVLFLQLYNGASQQRIAPEFLVDLLASPSPYLRRASAFLLAAGNRTAFLSAVPTLTADPSPLVREVVPAATLPFGFTWTTHFGPNQRDSDLVNGPRIPVHSKVGTSNESLQSVIHTMLRDDPDPQVRGLCTISAIANGFGPRPTTARNAIAGIQNESLRQRLVTDLLELRWRLMDNSDAYLLGFIEKSDIDEDVRSSVLKQLRSSSTTSPELAGSPPTTSGAATDNVPPDRPTAEAPRGFTVIYFFKRGCQDCTRVERTLDDIAAAVPGVTIERHNIDLVASLKLNEVLAEHFQVPAADRLVAPSVFAGGGALIRTDITDDALYDLVRRSAEVEDATWYARTETESEAAGERILSRFADFTLPVVLLAGLIDGVNPCAFATIVFLVSYLRIARRTPREILQIGFAFVGSVFTTYFLLGLGIRELVVAFGVLEGVGRAFIWFLGLLTLVLGIVSLVDALRSRSGSSQGMILALPRPLRERINATIRKGVRRRDLVIAAMGMGVVISLLELACTGQVYLPTIYLVLESGGGFLKAASFLLAYNLAFVSPLALVTVLTWRGLSSDRLLAFFQAHIFTTKLLTALLFFLLALMIFSL